MFAYCNNNPINICDPTGTWGHVIAGGILGAVVGAVSQMACNIIDNTLVDLGISDAPDGKKSVFDGVGKAMFWGAFGGAATALFPGASCAISATMSAAESVISDVQAGASLGMIVVNATLAAGFGAATSGDPTFSDPKILSNTVRAIKNVLPGNHPVVKNAANRFLRKTAKKVTSEFFSGVSEGVFVNYVSEGTKWYANSYLGLQ